MPNNKYQRSVKRERELVNDHAGEYLSARTAGSKSKGTGKKTDVITISLPHKSVILHQVKTKKGGRGYVAKDEVIGDGFTLIYRHHEWG